MDLFKVSAAKMGLGVIHRNKIMSLVLYIWFVFFVVADFQIFFSCIDIINIIISRRSSSGSCGIIIVNCRHD